MRSPPDSAIRCTAAVPSVLVVRPGYVRTKMSAGVDEAPFACDADDVATAVVKGLRRGSSVVWAPAVLQGHVRAPALRARPDLAQTRSLVRAVCGEDASMTVERQPALDGVRALALVLVLFFHAGYSWMPAGYMGVSVFFTLSGLPDHQPAAHRVRLVERDPARHVLLPSLEAAAARRAAVPRGHRAAAVRRRVR